MNKWLFKHRITKVENTLDAFEQLEPYRESVAEQSEDYYHRMKTLYSYDVRDSDTFRYIYKVE